MKKKLLVVVTFVMLTFALTACDLLSTINAISGFYKEYTNYSDIYNNATKFTVDTQTELTISQSTIDEILPVDTDLSFMVDNESPFMYVDQQINGERQKSVYENHGDLYIQYLIDDNNVVTPTLPPADERFDTNVTIFNENLSANDFDKENKTGDRTYEFDLVLSKAVDLDALGTFVDQLKVFDASLTQFNNAVAHVIVTFHDEDSWIQIDASVTDYNITFDDDSSITFSITNHTDLKIPADFSMPDVFSDPYQMVAVDDKALATKVYAADELIAYPVAAGENGWVQLNLEQGTYKFQSDHLNDLSGSMIYDSSETVVPFDEDGNYTFVIAAAGTYYLYVVPTASFQSDMIVSSTITMPTSDTTK